MLNVNGHDRKDGKAVRYKQLRCINLAKRGMLALNPEWIGMGQLNTFGLFSQSSRQARFMRSQRIECLFPGDVPWVWMCCSITNMPTAERVAVTGLSGGGWQTIILSSLDKQSDSVLFPLQGTVLCCNGSSTAAVSATWNRTRTISWESRIILI